MIDVTSDDNDLGSDTVKFALGQSLSRTEDPRLLTGKGCFADDLNFPGQVYGLCLRSPVAHGVLKSLACDEARNLPGVLAIYTAGDMIEAGYKPFLCTLPLKSRDGQPLIAPDRFSMAVDKVRYVGEILAFVVAESLAQARDAADAILYDIDALPAVGDVSSAAAGKGAVIHDAAPDNVCLDWRHGDAAALEDAFARADHVTRLKLVNNRIVVAAMEPRAAIAEPCAGSDGEDARMVLHLPCQGVFAMRAGISGLMNFAAGYLRVRSYDVGGSFGMKSPPYPEYLPLLHAARALGRPVKWCDSRSESFLSDQHGRDAVVDGQLALDAAGNFLAVRIKGVANMGAYLSSFGPSIPTMNAVKNLPGVYRTPLIGIEMKCLFTNTTPVGAYRGAGRPEAVYYMERLIDRAARETGRDPAALRRQNFIPSDAMPYRAASGLDYDSGDFSAVLDAALAQADCAGFAARKQASAAEGKRRGFGLASYLEVTAPARPEMGGLRFGDDGRVTIVTGTLNYGQGHAISYAQVLADKLGIPIDRIDLLQGDSDELIAGGGTGGSRSMMASSSAILAVADKVIEKAKPLAAHILEAAVEDIEFTAGAFRISGTDRAMTIMALAAELRQHSLPGDSPASLDEELIHEGVPSAYPNGCHVVEVEVDPDTGKVEVVRYLAVDDFGTLVNPMLVEGQVHGGVAQGLGQALMENPVYDDDGQPLAGSFMDYALPRADDLPDLLFASHPVPATTNPLGVKGCGEAGCTGALPALMNAITDALWEDGVRDVQMPTTPERVWRAIQAARR